MSDHIWGDKQFDWDGLGKAMDDIRVTTKEELGLDVMLKEKYGTIRYEHIGIWNWKDTADIGPEVAQFTALVLNISDKYPHIKEEILEDLYDTFDIGAE